MFAKIVKRLAPKAVPIPAMSFGLAAMLALSDPALANDPDPEAARLAEVLQFQEASGYTFATEAAPQIIGGWRVRDAPWRRNFRWVVSLGVGRDYPLCGGSLIDPEWVLTSAICANMINAGHASIVADTRDLSSGGDVIPVTGFVQHPDFIFPEGFDLYNWTEGTEYFVANDIALVRLSSPVLDVTHASPATPAQAARVQPGWTLGALGWGRTADSVISVDELRQVRMRVWPQRRCVNFYDGVGNATMPVPDDMMCTGLRRGGRGTCGDDAGGPLTMRMQGNPVVIGVANFPVHGCGLRRIPPTFTRVGNHYDWIQSVLVDGNFGCYDDNTPAPIRRLDMECYTTPNFQLTTDLLDVGFNVRLGNIVSNLIAINNNGHLVGFPFPPYLNSATTPQPMNTLAFPMLAPFWTDLNHLGYGYHPATYGTTTIDGKRAFVVNWRRVGFAGQAMADTSRNAFQVVVTETTPDSGNVQIEINYGQIEFDSPDGGTTVARAGFVIVAGDANNIVEMAGSGVSGGMVDGGPNALTSNSNVGVNGRYVWDIVDGQLVP